MGSTCTDRGRVDWGTYGSTERTETTYVSVSKEGGIVRVRTHEDYGIAVASVSRRLCGLGAPLTT
jgi:hypothetical protein